MLLPQFGRESNKWLRPRKHFLGHRWEFAFIFGIFIVLRGLLLSTRPPFAHYTKAETLRHLHVPLGCNCFCRVAFVMRKTDEICIFSIDAEVGLVINQSRRQMAKICAFPEISSATSVLIKKTSIIIYTYIFPTT